MVKWLVSIMMVGSLLALTPVRAPIDDANQQNVPGLPPAGRIQSDILTEAFVNNNSNRDYQTNGPTATMLWAVFDEPIKGVYATMMFQNPPGVSGRHQVWNFFDINTDQWVRAGDNPYLAVDRGGYGNIAVIYGNATYLYHPAFTAHMDATNYTGDAWWPDIPFDPRNFSGQYVQVPGQETNEVWPHLGFTMSGYLHKIFADYDGHMSGVPYATMYNRIPDLNNPAWDGYIPLETGGEAPWYGFYADPFGKTVVVSYCRTSTDYHTIMLIDTMEGEMFYAGVPIEVDVTQEIINKFNLPPDYSGYINDGNPFVDKDGNIHLITFITPPTWPDTFTRPTNIYHFFYNLSTGTSDASFIKSLTGPYQCSPGVNTLAAGRSQIGQERGLGTLYAVWEEFVPNRCVTSSNGYQRAVTRIVFATSKDNGATWAEQTLLVSDSVPGSDNNDWLRFPVISPIIPHVGNLDLVYWGVYWDDDPGFVWRGIGANSTVKMLVGRKEVGVEEAPITLKDGRAKISWNGRNITLEIPYKANAILKILDETGREISTIFKGNIEGKHNLRWNGKSGVYFINLKTEKENIIQKIILK